jgi:tripartite-type tricarboxylate transporter receptor subunit TctC
MQRQSVRKRFNCVYLLLVFSALLSPGFGKAEAQDFPTKPVTLIVPYGPGGSFDLTGRALVSVAMDYLGQPLVFQLKPGGGGVIGSDMVAGAAPDGHTILFAGPGPNSTIPAIEGRSKGPDDLAAVCRINYSPPIIMVRSDAPFKTFKDVVDWAKANPGKMTFGHTGVWGAADLPWKQIRLLTGIVTRDVPHTGGGPALLALLGGQVQVASPMGTQAKPHIKAGKLRPLAIMDIQRDPELPDVPTLKELGINVTYFLWKGIAAPKATPRPIIDKLALAFKKMTEDNSFVTMVKQFGDDIQYLGPDELAKVWKEEFETHKKLGQMMKK